MLGGVLEKYPDLKIASISALNLPGRMLESCEIRRDRKFCADWGCRFNLGIRTGMKTDGMTEEEATAFFDFNIASRLLRNLSSCAPIFMYEE